MLFWSRPLLLAVLSGSASALLLGGAARPAAAPRCATAPAMMAKAPAKGKDMQVILTSEVKGLGKKGDLVSVKAAYAENFILSKGLGKVATTEMLQQIAAEAATDKAAKVAAQAAAEQNKKTLEAVFGSQGAFLKKKVGPDGAMFGSVTAAEIADLIEERAGIALDKKGIEAPKLKCVGAEVIEITLHRDVFAKLKLTVVPAALS